MSWETQVVAMKMVRKLSMRILTHPTTLRPDIELIPLPTGTILPDVDWYSRFYPKVEPLNIIIPEASDSFTNFLSSCLVWCILETDNICTYNGFLNYIFFDLQLNSVSYFQIDRSYCRIDICTLCPSARFFDRMQHRLDNFGRRSETRLPWRDRWGICP